MTRPTLKVVDGGSGGPAPPDGGAPGSDDWRFQLTRSNSGAVQGTMHNLLTILEHDESLKGLVALDEFANRIVLNRDPPWRGFSSGEFAELDGTELAGWLGHPTRYQMAVKSAMVLEAIEATARRKRFHPVRDYLGGLVWDGVERIPTLFPTHCGTPDDEYHQRVAVIFMLSAAARILRPGCKVDTMLVLEGQQGLGKTKVTQMLFGGDRWYMDAQRSPAEKDFYQDIVGKWGVEIGEMTSFTKAEANKVKQTLSNTADVYRASYARYSKTHPRQCVFIGTTNETEWQRDHTGGRRFLPVRVNHVDVEGIATVRDQLWAEAVARFERGEDWWNLPDRAKEEQDERYIEDAWALPLLHWLSGHGSAESYERLISSQRTSMGDVPITTVYDVMTRALRVEPSRITKADQMRVGAILTRWRWESVRTRVNGQQVRVWRAPEDWAPAPAPASRQEADDGQF
jgi:predicted P-loop ATPase